MKVLTPVTRISLSLVLLTATILLTGDLIGLTPGPSGAILDSRKRLCETLAVQFALAAQKGDVQTIRKSLALLVDRNEDVLSAALRTADGRILASAGDHAEHWQGAGEDHKSTPSHAQVPIFRGDTQWATVEVRFINLLPQGIQAIVGSPLVRLMLFMSLAGFITYLFFMKKTLRHLDPSSVIPPRVQAALDVLSEGVLLLDERERIVLANAAFSKKLDRTSGSLMGRRASELHWLAPKSGERVTDLPWVRAVRDGESRTGVPLALETASEGRRTFIVNGSPILDGRGKSRGALATFDDVTELEHTNDQLQETLLILEKSRDEVRLQNEELQILATRDPLTGCFNRRYFFEQFKIAFSAAQQEGRSLCCIMGDIDHFKAVNDRFGHSVGDEVIQKVAEIFQTALGDSGTICRYGGEEFCVFLPDVEIDRASELAEAARRSLEARCGPETSIPDGELITGSLGVSALASGAENCEELIDQADQALYASKEHGRNRVTRWDAIEVTGKAG